MSAPAVASTSSSTEKKTLSIIWKGPNVGQGWSIGVVVLKSGNVNFTVRLPNKIASDAIQVCTFDINNRQQGSVKLTAEQINTLIVEAVKLETGEPSSSVTMSVSGFSVPVPAIRSKTELVKLTYKEGVQHAQVLQLEITSHNMSSFTGRLVQGVAAAVEKKKELTSLKQVLLTLMLGAIPVMEEKKLIVSSAFISKQILTRDKATISEEDALKNEIIEMDDDAIQNLMDELNKQDLSVTEIYERLFNFIGREKIANFVRVVLKSIVVNEPSKEAADIIEDAVPVIVEELYLAHRKQIVLEDDQHALYANFSNLMIELGSRREQFCTEASHLIGDPPLSQKLSSFKESHINALIEAITKLDEASLKSLKAEIELLKREIGNAYVRACIAEIQDLKKAIYAKCFELLKPEVFLRILKEALIAEARGNTSAEVEAKITKMLDEFKVIMIETFAAKF